MTLAELLRDRARLDAFLDSAIDALDPAAPVPPPIEAITDEWLRLGLRPGDVVLVTFPNGRFLLHHLFAVLAAGGIPALLPAASPPGRLAMIAEAFGARAIVTMRVRPLERAASWRALGGGEALLLPERPTPDGAVAGDMILMTSGTSGISSGCLFEVDALLRNAAKHAAAIGMTNGDALLVTLPLHFSYALVAQAFAALVTGARIVISGPPFQTAAYVRTIGEYGVTVSSITPILARHLRLDHPVLPARLRALTIGGDQLAAADVVELLRRAPDRELYLTYGLSEAGPRVSTLAAHAEPEKRLTSVGLPLPGTRVFFADAAADAPRELLISSDTLMKSRVGLVVGKPKPWHAPNVLATGDFFTIDEDGYLYFRGRAADFAMTGGEKVSLASVRGVVASIEGVVSAKTNVVTEGGNTHFDLILTLAGGAQLTEASVRRELNRVLTRAEHPRSIEIIAATASPAYK